MTENSEGIDALPSSLTRRIPISLDGVVAEGPEFVNHGSDYYRWRLVREDGTLAGQVRVYRGRTDERGGREQVYIPPRGTVEQNVFSLPHAEKFSDYVREHLEAYLQAQSDVTPIDVALRRGPTIVGVVGTTYFLRWNVYFKDEKIGEYTVHDMSAERSDVISQEGERSYKGSIPGYVNSHVVAWNEEVRMSQRDPMLLTESSVSLRWARLPGTPTVDNRYPIEWKRGDFLNIPFP